MTDRNVTSDAAPATLFDAVSAGLVFSCLRSHGGAITADVELEVTQRLHAAWQPDEAQIRHGDPAVRAASAQQTYDGLQHRYPDLYIESSGRVWLKYQPPHPFSGGLRAPSTGLSAIPHIVSQAWHRGAHARTAEKFGGPSIVFVHTHDMTDGDAFDAGYFVDLRRPVARGGHYRRSHGVDAPSFRAEVADPSAHSHSSRGWDVATIRMSVLGELLGHVSAIAVIEHAWRIVLGSYWAWLPSAFGVDKITNPSDAAHLLGRIFAATGTTVEFASDAEFAEFQHGPLKGRYATLPTAYAAAVVSAFGAVLPNFDWSLRAVAIPPLSATDRSRVRFDSHGPAA